MDRRRWGFVLVIGVLLLALVVPNVSGRRIAGRSLAAPIAGPPQVGDCLTWPSPWGGPPISASRPVDAGDADGADADEPADGDRAAIPMVPCDPHQGEILQMATDVADLFEATYPPVFCR
jgi:hypothetical protein